MYHIYGVQVESEKLYCCSVVFTLVFTLCFLHYVFHINILDSYSIISCFLNFLNFFFFLNFLNFLNFLFFVYCFSLVVLEFWLYILNILSLLIWLVFWLVYLTVLLFVCLYVNIELICFQIILICSVLFYFTLFLFFTHM